MVCFSRSYKMFNIRVFFSNFNILDFFWLVTLTTYDVNKSIRNGIFDLIIIITDLLESLRLTYIVNDDTSIGTFIIMGDNRPVNLLSTRVVVIIPCFFTLFDIVINRKCHHTSIVIKVMLVPCQ